MKRLFLALLLTLPFIYSCDRTIVGSDTMTDQVFTIDGDVEEIGVSAAMKLNLLNSIAPGELKITANSNIHEYIEVKRRTNSVSIELKSNGYRDVEITVYASAAQYNSVSASGASKVVKESQMGDFSKYNVDLSGASSFVGDVTVTDEVTVSLSGASTVKLNGSADECSVKASGASDVLDYNFVCDDLDVDLSGSSTLKMVVNRKITGAISGSSKLTYSGDVPSGDIDVDLSGSSTISKR